MRKAMIVGICVITLLSCMKNNSNTPISDIQLAMNGIWQVDSVRSMYKNAIVSDSVYKSHFVTITSEGNRVNINMSAAETMTYIISGNSLAPYSGRSAGGCGTPIAPTQVAVTSNTLQLITTQGFNPTDITVSTVYMHR